MATKEDVEKLLSGLNSERFAEKEDRQMILRTCKKYKCDKEIIVNKMKEKYSNKKIDKFYDNANPKKCSDGYETMIKMYNIDGVLRNIDKIREIFPDIDIKVTQINEGQNCYIVHLDTNACYIAKKNHSEPLGKLQIHKETGITAYICDECGYFPCDGKQLVLSGMSQMFFNIPEIKITNINNNINNAGNVNIYNGTNPADKEYTAIINDKLTLFNDDKINELIFRSLELNTYITFLKYVAGKNIRYCVMNKKWYIVKDNYLNASDDIGDDFYCGIFLEHYIKLKNHYRNAEKMQNVHLLEKVIKDLADGEMVKSHMKTLKKYSSIRIHNGLNSNYNLLSFKNCIYDIEAECTRKQELCDAMSVMCDYDIPDKIDWKLNVKFGKLLGIFSNNDDEFANILVLIKKMLFEKIEGVMILLCDDTLFMQILSIIFPNCIYNYDMKKERTPTNERIMHLEHSSNMVIPKNNNCNLVITVKKPGDIRIQSNISDKIIYAVNIRYNHDVLTSEWKHDNDVLGFVRTYKKEMGYYLLDSFSLHDVEPDFFGCNVFFKANNLEILKYKRILIDFAEKKFKRDANKYIVGSEINNICDKWIKDNNFEKVLNVRTVKKLLLSDFFKMEAKPYREGKKVLRVIRGFKVMP